MLQELMKELEAHKYTEKGDLSDETMNTLRKMFSVPGGYNAMFAFLVQIESERGVQGAYDIESIQTSYDGAKPEDVDQEVTMKKFIARWARNKMESARLEFKKEIEDEIQLEKDKQEAIKLNNTQQIAQAERTASGVGDHV